MITTDCNTGYTGTRCSTCISPGYYKFNLKCVACPSETGGSAFSTFALIIVAILVYVFLSSVICICSSTRMATIIALWMTLQQLVTVGKSAFSSIDGLESFVNLINWASII